MDLRTLLSLCWSYRQLGGAVQSQLDDVRRGEIIDCNVNALAAIRDFLRQAADANVTGAAELATHINDYLTED